MMLLFQFVASFVFMFAATNCENIQRRYIDVGGGSVEPVYSFWPLNHPASRDAGGVKLWKRDTAPVGQSEGGAVLANNKKSEKPITSQGKQEGVNIVPENKETLKVPGNTTNTNNSTLVAAAVNDAKANTTFGNATEGATTTLKPNMTLTETAHSNQMDLSNPGVVKRGLIVFGGFSLLAVAYFIFYRRKKNIQNENINSHNAPDSLQFRYGVLQSSERDNLELSRVPLTLESDDDDDDDLEIFDLEQKKKSLSYMNLKSQPDDVETFSIMNDNDQTADRDNLLLDIDDKNTETLINFTGNNSRAS